MGGSEVPSILRWFLSGLFLFLLIFLWDAPHVSAATYYVDNSITDTNVGLATPDCTNYDPAAFVCSGGSASAYATIADVNALTLSPGDSVLLRRGQLWRETLVLKSSGTSGNEITVGAYGSGDKPMLKGSDIKANASFVLYDAPTNTYYVAHTASGANVNAVWEGGTKLTSASSIANCQATAGSSYYDNTAHRVYIHSAQADPDPITNGLVYEAATRKVVVDGSTNSNDYVVYEYLDIRHGYSELSAMVILGDYNTVRNSDFYDNSNHHLNFEGAYNLGVDLYGQNCAGGAFIFYSPTSHDNTFQRIQSLGTTVWTASAIQSHGGAYDNTVEYSYFNQTVLQTASVGAVSFNSAISGYTVRYNKIEGYWKNAIDCNTGSNNVTFYGNVVYGTNFKANNTAIYIHGLVTPSTGFVAYNNTFKLGGYGAIQVGDAAGSSATFKNNIVKITSDWYVMTDAGTTFTSDYNVFYGSVRGTPFWYLGTQYSFANYKSTSGQDAHSVVADPLFNDFANNQLWLQSASPARDAGADLGSAYSNGLDPVSTWPSNVFSLYQNTNGSQWEIGAYVYSAPRPPSGAGGAAAYWRRLYEDGLAPPDFVEWWEGRSQSSSSSSSSSVSSSSSSANGPSSATIPVDVPSSLSPAAPLSPVESTAPPSVSDLPPSFQRVLERLQERVDRRLQDHPELKPFFDRVIERAMARLERAAAHGQTR